MEHVHTSNCTCKQFQGSELSDDLLQVINIPAIQCLNEKIPNSAQTIFKPHSQKFDKTHFVQSDMDGQILLIVPFISIVKIKSFCIIATNYQQSPNVARVYINEQNIDFNMVQNEPIEQYILTPVILIKLEFGGINLYISQAKQILKCSEHYFPYKELKYRENINFLYSDQGNKQNVEEISSESKLLGNTYSFKQFAI